MVRKNLHHQIPKEWKYDLLDKFTDRRSGHTPSQSFPEYWNGGVKWISLADSYRLDKGFITESEKKISEKGLQNSSAELHPKNTVVMTRDAGIGKSGILASEMAVSQHFIAWRCDNKNTISSWYLYNWLQFYKHEFERQAVGSTIKTLGLPYFRKLKIALPPFSEQTKIANIFLTWDKAIETTEKLINNSQAQKRALMQQLLTGKKRLLDENGERFSGKWEKGNLKAIAKVAKGKALSSKNLLPGIFPVIAGGRSSPYKHAEYTHENIITVSASGAFAGYVAYHNYKIWASDCSTIMGKNRNNTHFIYYVLSLLQNKIYSLQSGGAQPHIYPKDLDSLTISFPTNELEQISITTVLSNADQEIELLEKNLKYLKQEKKALMQQLLTGKRRVKVDN